MPRILLTEDEADQRNLYHDVLTEAGYEVWDAWTGPEALEMFHRYKPDIVILDIQMPGMDGIEALGQILSKDRKIPIILHSAFPAYKANFLTWAADAFVVKSGDPAQLVRAVRDVSDTLGIEKPEPKKVAG